MSATRCPHCFVARRRARLRRVRIVLEAVPNVSEARDAGVVAAIGEAFGRGATLLDVHSDADHHRSVFTLVGDENGLIEALLSGIRVAVDRIDLRAHSGAHPRIGVADVVPLVPLDPGEMEQVIAVARTLAQRIGDALGLPVFLYGEAAGGVRPVFFRRGGLEALARRVAEGELVPDAGPDEVDPRSGGVLVGARQALIAYNLDLATDDLEIATSVAVAVRGSSGGMRGVQAIGLRLPESRRTQVSMNVIDLDAAPLHEVVERVRSEAHARGTDILAGELVGLVPQRVVDAAAAAGVELPGVDASQVLERVLRSRLAE
jgi:glutamate formiminotransferase / 5-formyltetrahydrofolate cyclo-ligase